MIEEYDLTFSMILVLLVQCHRGDLILIYINSMGASVVEVVVILIEIIINRYHLFISYSCLFY